MLAGRRQQEWLIAADLLAMLANTHLERFQRKRAFTSREFLPPDVRRDTPLALPAGNLTLDDMTDFLPE